MYGKKCNSKYYVNVMCRKKFMNNDGIWSFFEDF